MNANQLRSALNELGYSFIVGAPSPYDKARPKRRQDFADLARVLPTTVSRWLTGKRPVPSYIDVIIELLIENQRLKAQLNETDKENLQ
jgi:transcriptional regulator with XRE-family HTH domain